MILPHSNENQNQEHLNFSEEEIKPALREARAEKIITGDEDDQEVDVNEEKQTADDHSEDNDYEHNEEKRQK